MVYTDKLYIADLIKKARKSYGLKQSQLAEKVGISEKHLSKIETGKNYPALDNFLRLVETLNLSLDDFGIKSYETDSINKQKILKIINVATDKELALFLDVIEVLIPHIK